MNIVTNLRITTSVKTNASLYKQVEDAFHLLNKNKYIQNISIIKRKKLTIKQIFKSNDSPVIVFENTGPKLYFTSEIPIYFHLDTAKVKLNMVKNQQQPILSEMINHITSKESSFNFVDGTMGFGRDSYLVLKQFPNVNVFSIEQHPLIHFVISEGMKLQLNNNELKRIHFINEDYNNWVKLNEEKVDILYLDHMFEKTLIESDRMGELSNNILKIQEYKPIKHYNYLILKARFDSLLFKELNVMQCLRKSSKTHYGLRVNNSKQAL